MAVTPAEESPPASPASSPVPLDATSPSSTARLGSKTVATGTDASAASASPTSATTSGMTPSSTPLGSLNAARRPGPQPSTISSRGSGLNVSQDILARIQAVHLGRQGAPPNPNCQKNGSQPRQPSTPGSPQSAGSPFSGAPGSPLVAGPGGVPAQFKLPPSMAKPQMKNFASAPSVPSLRMGNGNKPSLAEKRGQMLNGHPTAPPTPNGTSVGGGRKRPALKLSQINGDDSGKSNGINSGGSKRQESLMDKYSEYIDKETGTLRFKGKATINSDGVQFSSGTTFNISLDEVDTLDELGKGNYGTVYKVRHSRPRLRRPGLGLAGNRSGSLSSPVAHQFPALPVRRPTDSSSDDSPTSAKSASGSGVVMAMKEIRLELDDAKFAAIIMELDILHRCISPYIVDFYGAFFQEGAVYICLEFMDGGSIDKLYLDGISENILRKITLATTVGLKFLKEKHNIIHRDVKPTNILVNTRGQVKICDFGVSGNLVASIAKTNIGCQSYMAPERISSGGVAQAGANPGGGTYSVQSDIWSLGLTIIECALGRYPYPPETYNNIFSQLSAIVDGEPPDLPAEGYSDAARNFVRGCLNKIPNLRPTYAMLLQHPWLAPLLKPATIVEDEEDDDPEADESRSTGSLGSTGSEGTSPPSAAPRIVDAEVADWVLRALERKRHRAPARDGGRDDGTGAAAGGSVQPAQPPLHAAPLDAVTSPSKS